MNNTVRFRVEKRYNSISHWVLHCRVGDREGWIVFAWEHEPTDIEIKEISDVVMRGMQLYHSHFQIPPFQLTSRIDYEIL